MNITPPSDDAALRRPATERPRPVDPSAHVAPVRPVEHTGEHGGGHPQPHRDDWVTLGAEEQEEQPPASETPAPAADEATTPVLHIDVTV